MKLLNAFRKKKYKNIKEYVSNKIGDIHLLIPSQIHDDFDIEVIIVKPTKEKPYYTLITNGLSNYEMKLPRHIETNSFCELLIYLPEDWKILNPNINYYWPIKSLFELAAKLVNSYGWVSFSSIINLNRKVADNCSFNSFLFVIGINDEAMINNKYVSFYTLIPVYDEEVIYAKQYGNESLFDKLVNEGLVYPPIVDINRKIKNI